ncbi:amidohydrolase family protein, partial [Eggerthella lenta]
VKKKEAMNRLATNVDREAYDRYLANNIYFDMTHPMSWSKDQLELAVKTCGADHLLLGSSFPVFYEWMARSVGSVKALDVTQEEKDLMLGGNAAKLFNL